MIPMLVLGVPIFDTTLVVISRLRRRRNPFTTPGKDHFSHRLVSFGLSQREAVLTIYVVAFCLGMLAVLLSTLVLRSGSERVSVTDLIGGYAIGGAVALGAGSAVVYLERHWQPPRPAAENTDREGPA
jgi:UDP-GlcNAc:undecaprenyl-phosphate GlcNAc-1-phosphate transferase